jgi:hypothetical protein
VSQLALPYRIALVALLAFAGLWFVALRPKSNSGSSTPAAQSQPVAPGVKGLTNAIAKAHNASAQSDAANARIQAATGGTAAASAPATAAPATSAAPSKPASSAPAAPALGGVVSGDLSAPLIAALGKDKTVVLVFAGSGADDRSVVRAAHQLSRHHGRVVVKVAPIAQVGRYAAITRGAQVGGAPTTLVIGPNRAAQAIVGFTGVAEIQQAVGDALAWAK